MKLYNPREVISLPGAMSIAWMCLGRLISGCAVGLLSTVVALYQSEVAPAHMRGGLTSLYLAGDLEVEFSGEGCLNYLVWGDQTMHMLISP